MNSFNIPEKEQRIWTTLLNAGFDTYLVGGAVRDMVLGKEPKDFDLATAATPKQIEETLAPLGYSIGFHGATFGTTYVDDVEVATFRSEVYHGGGDKDVETTFAQSIEEDLGRRDFTINAMAVSINGDLIDHFDGQSDLKNGILRFVGDPVRRIFEDPNRIIRLARFTARFDNCIIDPNSLNAVIDQAPNRVHLIAMERVHDELIKVMESAKFASKFFGALFLFGVLDEFFPGMSDGIGHAGGKYHPETVWEHNMMVGDHISPRFPLTRLAGFLHDIGKPRAFVENEGVNFSHHDKIGAKMARTLLVNLRFSKKEVDHIVNLIDSHMRMARDIMTPKARRRTLAKFAEHGVDWRDFARIRIADTEGNLNPGSVNSVELIRSIVRTFTQDVPENNVFGLKDLAVSGGDLIDVFDLTPGPIVGVTNRALLEFVLDNGEEFNTRPQLLAEAKRILGV